MMNQNSDTGMSELEAWLDRNKEHLTTYTLNEIADVAVASGFRRSDMATWITKQKFQGKAA